MTMISTVLVHGKPIFLNLKSPDQTPTGGTLALVAISDIDEIPLAEAAFRHVARRLGPWHDPGVIAVPNFFPFAITAIGQRVQLIGADGVFGLRRHVE